MTNVNFMAFFGTSPLATMPPLGGTGGAGAMGGNSLLGLLLKGLGEALQGLAGLIGGGDQAGGAPGLPFQPTSPAPGTGSGVAEPGAKPIAGSARIWGDPHFIGADGGKFDVQGEAGKTYNLLSDRGFQMNGRFEKWGDGGATVVGEVGITAGTNYVNVDKSGKAVVNGHVLKDGERVNLRDGGYAEKKGNEVIVKKGEWEVNFQTHRDHINMDIKTDNAIADGVKPHGLIGQTFDGDGKARNGDAGAGVQGGGAIEDVNGNITSTGDKNAVKSYEVSQLWSTNFQHHNRDYGQGSMYSDAADRGRDSRYRFEQDLRSQLANMAMMGYMSLFSSLFSTSGSFGWGYQRA